MKRKILLFSLVAFFGFVNAHAQISKGSIFLGGQISFYSDRTSYDYPGSTGIVNAPDSKNSTFSISPSIGKAIKDNIIVGVDINYNHNQVDGYNSNAFHLKQQGDVYGAGFFMRRYVPIGKGFYVFGQGRFGASYNTGKITAVPSTGSVQNNKGYQFDLLFYPGISYQVSKRLQLETGFNGLFNIDYQHTKTTTTNTDGSVMSEQKDNTFNASTSLNNLANFTLGFRVLLSKQ